MELEIIKQKILKGSALGVGRLVLAMPIYLALTPFVLDRLGAEMFGIWSFSTIMIAVLTLTDFGFKNALVYHIARIADRPDEIQRHFSVAYLNYLVLVAIVVVGSLVLGRDIARHVLRVPEPMSAEAAFVLVSTAVSFGLRFLAIPYQGILEARQELYYSQLVFTGWLLLNSVGTVVALLVRADVYALGAVSILSNLWVFLAFYRRVRRRFGFARVTLRGITWAHVGKMLSYGTGIQLATLAIALREPIFKVLLARYADLHAVATFEIVYRLSTQVVAIVVTPLLGTFAASALLVDRTRDLEAVLSPLFRFALTALVPLALLLGSFSPLLVTHWLGSDFMAVGQLLPWTFLAFAVYYLTEVLYKAIEGSGSAGYSAAVQFVSLGIGVAVFAMAMPDVNRAIAAGLLAGFAFFSAANVFVFRRRFPDVRLVRAEQLAALAVPALIYVAAAPWLDSEARGAWYLVYLSVHVWAARRAGVFDFIGVTRQCLAALGAR